MQYRSEKIQIQGPESVVNKIKSVVATVEADGLSSDATKKQNHTDRPEWRTNVGRISAVFNISDDHYVNVSMKLWRVKDNVKIKANCSGTPAKDTRWIRLLQRRRRFQSPEVKKH